MKKFIWSVFCIVLLPLFSHAEPRLTRDKIFSVDSMSESFTIPGEFGHNEKSIILNSPQANRELITDKKRSIVKIDSLEKLADLPPDLTGKIIKVVKKKGLKSYYVFANFSHSSPLNTNESEFYVAIIDKNAKIDHLAFQIEWFGNGAGAHAQVRMKFNSPITIIPQDSESHPIMTLDDGDITYSLQAIKVQGDNREWSPFAGLMGEYANALQFFSTQSKAKQQIVNSVVQNFVLEGLTQPEKQRVFLKALNTSDEFQEDSIYNTVYNSCITHALLALKAGVPSIDTTHFNPYSVKQSLRNAVATENQSRSDKNKIVLNDDVPTANVEFGELVEGPVMTSTRIKSKPAFQAVQKFIKILTSNEFDNIIKDISLFMIKKEITWGEVENVIAEVKAGKDIHSLARSQSTQILFNKISSEWEQHFQGKTMIEFVTLLEALKTQNL